MKENKKRKLPMNHDENLADYIRFSAVIAGVFILSVIAYNIHDGRIFMDWMKYFMAAYFLVFGFFKLSRYDNFVNAYMLYDVIAKRNKYYAQIFPFLELLIGSFYLVGKDLLFTNLLTVLVMSISMVGVVQELKRTDRSVTCACLGTAINLPVTKITLVENLTMGVMALVMLFL